MANARLNSPVLHGFVGCVGVFKRYVNNYRPIGRKGEVEVRSNNICRICYETDPGLLSLCACKGSMGYVHLACLELWINRCNSTQCELCGTHYHVHCVPRHGIIVSLLLFLWENAAKLLTILLLLMGCNYFVSCQACHVQRICHLIFREENARVLDICGSTLDFVIVKTFFYVCLDAIILLTLNLDFWVLRYVYKQWKRYRRSHRHLRISARWSNKVRT